MSGDRGSKTMMVLRDFARLLGALLVLAVLTCQAVVAQPATANPPVDPDASAVKEQRLLELSPRIQGRIDIPDRKASVLMQPAGRKWVYFHEVFLHWLGAIAILGMLALLALAYLASLITYNLARALGAG